MKNLIFSDLFLQRHFQPYNLWSVLFSLWGCNWPWGELPIDYYIVKFVEWNVCTKFLYLFYFLSMMLLLYIQTKSITGFWPFPFNIIDLESCVMSSISVQVSSISNTRVFIT